MHLRLLQVNLGLLNIEQLPGKLPGVDLVFYIVLYKVFPILVSEPTTAPRCLSPSVVITSFGHSINITLAGSASCSLLTINTHFLWKSSQIQDRFCKAYQIMYVFLSASQHFEHHLHVLALALLDILWTICLRKGLSKLIGSLVLVLVATIEYMDIASEHRWTPRCGTFLRSLEV